MKQTIDKAVVRILFLVIGISIGLCLNHETRPEVIIPEPVKGEVTFLPSLDTYGDSGYPDKTIVLPNDNHLISKNDEVTYDSIMVDRWVERGYIFILSENGKYYKYDADELKGKSCFPRNTL